MPQKTKHERAVKQCQIKQTLIL